MKREKLLWRIIPSSWLDHRDSETDLCNKLKSYSWSKQGVESISVLFKVDVPIIQDVSLKQTISNNLCIFIFSNAHVQISSEFQK